MTFETFLHELGPYLTIIASYIGIFIMIRKSKSEVKNLDTDVAVKYQDMLLKEQDNNRKNREELRLVKSTVEELERKVDELQEVVKEYSAGIILLINQLQAERIKPVWKPKTTPIKYYENDEE